MNNPYSAPTAVINEADFGDHTYEPKIFSWNGRIGRLRYVAFSWAVAMLISLITGVLAAVLIPAMHLGTDRNGPLFAIMGLIYIPNIILTVTMGKRRLNDLNRSGWWLLLNLTLIIIPIFGLYLLLAPGTDGSNNFGPKPAKNPAILWVPMVLAILGIVYVSITAVTAYNDYAHRAKAAAAQQQQLQSQQDQQPQQSQ